MLHEDSIKDGIIKCCQHIFNKFKGYLRDQIKVNEISNLYRQANGVREPLKHLATTEALMIPAEIIDRLTRIEKDCMEKATSVDAIEIAKAESEVPLIVDGISLEEHADIDPYGSNNGLTTGDITLRMSTPASRTPTDLPIPADLASAQPAALVSLDPSSAQLTALITKDA